MTDCIHLRAPLPADHLEIAALITNLIPRYLARELTAEGIGILRENAQPGQIGARLGGLVQPNWSPAFVAVAGSRVVGFGAVRDDTHITQVQVDEAWHGRGLGARLVRALVAEVQRRHPRARAVTLNATSGALTAYLRMGLHAGRPALALARHHRPADGLPALAGLTSVKDLAPGPAR